MGLPDYTNTFYLLVAGLLTSAHLDWQVPYTPVFSQAINQLSCLLAANRSPIPASRQDWFSLFERPISEWWPADSNALGIQPEEKLALMFQGQPEDWLLEYFDTRDIDLLTISKSLTGFKSEVDQHDIKTLLQWCRINTQPDLYSHFRKFLITHPYASLWELSDFMLSWPGLKLPTQLQNFYEEPGPERIHEGELWECPYCHGILKWHSGIPTCIRASVCGRISSQYQGMRKVKFDSNIRVLKYGVHERTCVPGVPELTLHDLCAPNRIMGVTNVILWPGYDTYDLRVIFADQKAWAIDVKDLREADGLRRTIDKELGGLYAARDISGLEWEQAFYVVPDFRTKWTPGYLSIARSNNLVRGESELISLSEMVARIQNRASIAIKQIGV